MVCINYKLLYIIVYKLLTFICFITGNFSNNELSTVRLVPYGSINQSQTKGDGKQLFIKILKNNGSTSNGTIATVTTDKIMKVIPTKVYAPQVRYIGCFY